MKIGIMQPYYFPYLEYWQLMNLSDRYVIYDDVNYIKGGWINRNRILINHQASFIRVPTIGAGSNRKICEIKTDISQRFLEKTGRMLSGAYAKAPCFDEVFPVIMEMLEFSTDNLSIYLAHLIQEMAARFSMTTEFLVSSELSCATEFHGEERIIRLCKHLGGDLYLNASGGKKLYSYEHFHRNGLELAFLETASINYRQFGTAFVPDLSIIDVLMFNGWEKTEKYLKKINLCSEEGKDDEEKLLGSV